MKHTTMAAVLLLFAVLVVSCATAVTAPVAPAENIKPAAPATQEVAPAAPAATPEVKAEVKAEVKPVAKKADPVYEIKAYGYTISAKLVDNRTIDIEYPSFITKDEIAQAAKAAYGAFGAYLKNATYKFEGKGKLSANLGYAISDNEFYSYAEFVEKQLLAYVGQIVK